ncbi:MAG: LysM peptidoglycan-binding domain-containing protein, partial [Candidatus Hinthialibacter sp.]
GVSLTQLRRWNSGKIKRGDVIYPGDVLVISGGSPKAPVKSVDVYTVRRGDSLGKIAQRFRTTVKELKELNHFRRSNPTIHPGDKLKVPVVKRYSVAAAQAVHYTVKTGDSLGAIAESYGTTVSRLKQLNGYTSRNPVIRPGDKIRIR